MALGRSSTKKQDAVADDANPVVDPTPVEGNLVKVKEPKFISLVGKPANETGFKVVRADQEQGGKPVSNLIRRTRRSTEGASPVLCLTFPEGTDETSVQEALTNYGMSGYKVVQEDGVYRALRADLQSISKETTMDIKLSQDGLIATVARQDTTAPANPEDRTAIRMARVEFDASKFTIEEVQRWVSEKCVDGEVQQPQNAAESHVVRRGEIAEGEETRRLVLEDGVTAIIVRADATDVPAGFVTVVSEAAYGSWGWGQLDFAASMADEEFSDHMRSALSKLDDVLRNIILWSPLPLDVRKELANRALGQFSDYVSAVMDNLPRQLLVSVVRSATNQPEKEMTQNVQSGSAANTPEATPAAAAAPATTPAAANLTREDVQAMIADAVAALKPAAPAAEAAPVARSDASANTVTLSREDLTAALGAAVAKAQEPVLERLTKIEGQTVVRSATGDAATQPATPVKRDAFDGMFGHLRGSKAK